MRSYRVIVNLNGEGHGIAVTAVNKAGARRAVGGVILRVEAVVVEAAKESP